MGQRIECERISDYLRRRSGAPAGESSLEIVLLCDRLWPRGISRASLAGIVWKKEWAPSTPLRTGLHSGQLAPDEFRKRYRSELSGLRESLLSDLRELGACVSGEAKLRLLTASRTLSEGHLPVLAAYVEELLSPRPMP